MKKAGVLTTMAQRAKYQKDNKAARLDAYPTTNVLVRWKDQEKYTWEPGNDFKAKFKDTIHWERNLYKVAIR
jgi:hypothetical protein